ncbi:MAG TPA: hypothetical protein VNM72_01315 [Blastocatellia bacterium]|nr:hypothetical protein [Blastocatellia bacterium]
MARLKVMLPIFLSHDTLRPVHRENRKGAPPATKSSKPQSAGDDGGVQTFLLAETAVYAV